MGRGHYADRHYSDRLYSDRHYSDRSQFFGIGDVRAGMSSHMSGCPLVLESASPGVRQLWWERIVGVWHMGGQWWGKRLSLYGQSRPAMGTIMPNMNRIVLSVAEIQSCPLGPVALTWLTFMTSPMAANVACRQLCFSQLMAVFMLPWLLSMTSPMAYAYRARKFTYWGWYNYTSDKFLKLFLAGVDQPPTKNNRTKYEPDGSIHRWYTPLQRWKKWNWDFEQGSMGRLGLAL